jgi:hypothetical protein
MSCVAFETAISYPISVCEAEARVSRGRLIAEALTTYWAPGQYTVQ